MSMRDVNLFVSRLLAGLMIVSVPAGALGEGTKVGGHVGLATSLVTRTSESSRDTDISDTFTLVAPIGVTVKLSDRLAIDFETQVANRLRPKENATSSLVVAPGVVYDFGPFAAGLRVGSAIGAPSNVGVIPLIHRGLFPLGDATWFIEAAFPTFFHRKPDPEVTFDVVIHTGISF